MNHIRIIILLLCPPFLSFGQIDTADYDFLNAALPQIRKLDSPYFFLMEKSYPCAFSESATKQFLGELKGTIDPKIIKEIIGNSKKRTHLGPIKFDPMLISKKVHAKVVSGKFTDSLQRAKTTGLPLNQRIFYICSLPVFDNRKSYAVIDFGDGLTRLSLVGAKNLFKKIGEQWILIGRFDNWAT